MRYHFFIEGQIRGGKNNMKVTRFGRHYPNPVWAEWRDGVVQSLKKQAKAQGRPVFERLNGILTIELNYWPGDLKRRDVPAILDSIFHCLEKAEIVEDDSMLKNVSFIDNGLNRKNPRVRMWIYK